MKRVLLVTSSYNPTMIADMHRVRHLAWELPRLGWDVEVLAPDVQFQRPEFVEPESAALFNPDVPLHEVQPADRWWFRPLKIRGIGWRAFDPLLRAGRKLLAEKRYDLVYLSTANFKLFGLAPDWTARFGVPCVLDYHDPWVRDRIDFRTTRHKVKLVVGAILSRWAERRAVRAAAGIVSVSETYLHDLRRRYGALPSLAADRCATIPFAGSENDFRAVPVAQAGPGSDREVAYVGAGGQIMAAAFLRLCRALAAVREREPTLFDGLKIRLYGTSTDWVEGKPKALEDLAVKLGLAGVVEERPRRISYYRATEICQRAAGLLVLGIDGPGYLPSKLFGYALSGQPLLASFRGDSPMKALFQQRPGLGHPLVFDAAGDEAGARDVAQVQGFLREVSGCETFDRHSLIEEYLAPAMARRHVELFNRIGRAA